MRFLFILFIFSLFVSCSKEKIAGEFEEELQLSHDFTPTTTSLNITSENQDISECFYENNYVKLTANIPNIKSYSWLKSKNNEEDELIANDSSITISEAGSYILRAKHLPNESGEPYSISYIELTNCRTLVEIPSSFVPNGDGQFDTWFPILFGVSDFYVRISYENRKVIFESTTTEKVFNGEFKNEKLPSGSYIYYISGTYKSGYLFEKQGVLELVR